MEVLWPREERRHEALLLEGVAMVVLNPSCLTRCLKAVSKFCMLSSCRSARASSALNRKAVKGVLPVIAELSQRYVCSFKP